MDDLLGLFTTLILSRGRVCRCVLMCAHMWCRRYSPTYKSPGGAFLQGLPMAFFLEILIVPGKEKISLWTDVVSKSSPCDSDVVICHGHHRFKTYPKVGGHSVPYL